jgi:hypothetical protein
VGIQVVWAPSFALSILMSKINFPRAKPGLSASYLLSTVSVLCYDFDADMFNALSCLSWLMIA